jgi:prepilin-type N-terminal cleavage/methylation domain-containing protein
MSPTRSSTATTKGFTLVELLIAVGLMGIVITGVLGFVFQAMRVYVYDSGRLMVNRDMRTFTSSLSSDAVASNYFRIYTSFQSRTTPVTDGLSGDFLLLVFTDSNPSTGVYIITQLVGYYRAPADTTNPTSLGPVRRFSTLIAAADQSKDVPTLLAQYAPTTSANINPIVIQLAQGLSNGTLFYDYRDRSVMVRGQIVDYGSQGGRAAISTYNYTVSPRG